MTMRQRAGRVVLTMCVTLVLTVSASTAQSPTADAPAYTVGDQWRHTYGPTAVVGVEGDTTIFELPNNNQCKGCRFFRDKQLVLVRVLNPAGGEVKHPQIGLRFLEFPLAVGKQWTYEATSVNETTNTMVAMKHSFRVLAHEDLTTKAGVLKVFKIEHKRELAQIRDSRSRPDLGTAIYWYSPEAKTIARREVLTTGSARNFGNDFELETFSVK